MVSHGRAGSQPARAPHFIVREVAVVHRYINERRRNKGMTTTTTIHVSVLAGQELSIEAQEVLLGGPATEEFDAGSAGTVLFGPPVSDDISRPQAAAIADAMADGTIKGYGLASS
jgi:hypothetical protein